MIKTYTELRDEMIQGVVEQTTLTNLNPGSVVRTVLEVIAKVFSELYQLVLTVTRAGFVQTAEGKWLDLKVRELGLVRKPGTLAGGYVTFYRKAAKDEAVIIPEGTIIKTFPSSRGDVYRFRTRAEAVIEAGASEVFTEADAVEIGSAYNVGKGTITKMSSYISGVDGVINKDIDLGSGLRGWQINIGTNPETDDTLRNRAIYRWDELGVGGNADAYRSWVLAVPGITSVQILDNFPFGPGTVGLIVASENGLPTPELINAVHEWVSQKKPLTATIHVLSPIPKIVNLELVLERFSTFEQINVEEWVRVRLLSMNSSLAIGEKLIMSRLIALIMQVDGVYSVDIVTPLENVAAAPDELIQIGEVVISQTIKGRSYQDTEIIAGATRTLMGA